MVVGRSAGGSVGSRVRKCEISEVRDFAISKSIDTRGLSPSRMPSSEVVSKGEVPDRRLSSIDWLKHSSGPLIWCKTLTRVDRSDRPSPSQCSLRSRPVLWAGLSSRSTTESQKDAEEARVRDQGFLGLSWVSLGVHSGFPSGFNSGFPSGLPSRPRVRREEFRRENARNPRGAPSDLCLGEVCTNPIPNDRVTRMPRPHPAPRGFESV